MARTNRFKPTEKQLADKKHKVSKAKSRVKILVKDYA